MRNISLVRLSRYVVMASSVSAVFVLSPTRAPAATSQPALVSPRIQVFVATPALGEVQATSEFDCGIFFASCRFTYELDTLAIDPPIPPTFMVRWHDPNTIFDLKATMHLFGDHKEWYLDIPNAIAPPTANPAVNDGSVNFSGISGLLNQNGTAEYYVPPSQPIPVKGILDSLNEVGESLFELSNGLVENPTLASLTSSAEQLPSGDFRYSYTVVNGTDVPLTYDWPDAGMSGELGIGESMTTFFDSPLLPFAVIGASSISYADTDPFGADFLREYRNPVSTVIPLPIPEPAALVLLCLGMVGMAGRTRGPCKLIK